MGPGTPVPREGRRESNPTFLVPTREGGGHKHRTACPSPAHRPPLWARESELSRGGREGRSEAPSR